MTAGGYKIQFGRRKRPGSIRFLPDKPFCICISPASVYGRSRFRTILPCRHEGEPVLTHDDDVHLPSIPVKKTTEARDNLLFEERETLVRHTPYEIEKLGLACIRGGDTEQLEKLMERLSSQTVVAGNMSPDPLRQAKYVACCTLCMSTRAAIDGGVSEPVALCFSDETILGIDEMTDPDEVYLAIAQAVYRLTGMVRDNSLSAGRSAPVRASINYIQEHLHGTITLDQLAQEAGISRSHLCRLFRAETGESTSEYVLRRKLEEAASLLSESSYAVGEITSILGFASQSYFSACFKKRYGLTPYAYRHRNDGPG